MKAISPGPHRCADFDPDGTCSELGPNGQGFESTGAKAMLMADGNEGPGYVPIEEADRYCWTAETAPVFVLKAAEKVADKACTDPSYAALYKSVTNNYIAYFLQKRTPSKHLGPSVAQRDVEEAKSLCQTLLVAHCPAAKP